jgi:cobalamin biosynthetic protein CobC
MAMIPKMRSASLQHGGDLAQARRQFPGAPEPFVDLSTGINPHPYPVPPLSSDVFARLPQPVELERLIAAAVKYYDVPSPDHVVAAPGTQILLPLVAALIPPRRAAVLGLTYAEHARVAALAGHAVKEAHAIAELAQADLAMVVNPNNPDGQLWPRDAVLQVAQELQPHGGLLVADEAFMDVAPEDASLALAVDRGNIVVLRSFGKFFGLAGLRLGFALAAPELIARLAACLGPWAVSGPAMAIGRVALDDVAWVQATRACLAQEAQRLDDLLAASGLEILGGTPLFRLARMPAADALFHHLGRAGIWVRRFTEQPTWLRFGLPKGEGSWTRLSTALGAFSTWVGKGAPLS